MKAIVFNLGYLPGGDKKTVTRTECTLAALEQAAALIAPNGLLSVMCYPGHEGGKEEQKPAPEHRNTGSLPDMRLQAGLTSPPPGVRERPQARRSFIHSTTCARARARCDMEFFTSMGSWAKLRSYPSGTNSGS